jgi:hypothetical protein
VKSYNSVDRDAIAARPPPSSWGPRKSVAMTGA